MLCEAVASDAHHLVRSRVTVSLAPKVMGVCVESLSTGWSQCTLLGGRTLTEAGSSVNILQTLNVLCFGVFFPPFLSVAHGSWLVLCVLIELINL